MPSLAARYRGVCLWVWTCLWVGAVGPSGLLAQPASQPADPATWAGPVQAELSLSFAEDAGLEFAGGEILVEEGGEVLALTMPEPGRRLKFAAQCMIELPEGAAMATGPDQYLRFDVYYESARPVPWLVQIDEPGADGMRWRAHLGLPAIKPGVWQTVQVSLLRQEFTRDHRPDGVIVPDGTPMTRLGFKVDPRTRGGLTSAKIRNVTLYRQNKLAGAPVDARTKIGNTPLHRAAMLADVSLAKALLDQGADVNAINRYKQTPLALAVLTHDHGICALLVQRGADVNASRQLGFTPLYDAAAEGLTEVVSLLIENGADPVQQTQYKFEPLFTAVHHGHIATSARLIDDERVDVNQPIAGFMPLHVAAQGDDAGPHTALYEKLIELGAEVDLCSAAAAGDVARMKTILAEDPEAAKTTTILGGWTPLHDAVRNVRLEAVELLLEHGADPNAVSGEVDFNSSPVHWVSFNKLMDAPEAKVATLKVMVQAGAELNVVDRYGLTPLDRARADGDREVFRAMREAGARSGRELRAQRPSATQPSD